MVEYPKEDYVSKFERILEAINKNRAVIGFGLFGFAFFGVCFGLGYSIHHEIKNKSSYKHVANQLYQGNQEKTEKEKIKGLELKTGDYNNNNLLDKFYEIDGKKIPVEVDGKSIDDYLVK